MIWVWIISGLIVLVTLSAIWQVVARFLFAFVIAAGGLLILHARENPTEAGIALAALGGGVLLRGPIRRVIGLFV